MTTASDQAREAQALEKQLSRLLMGKDPGVQGAALANLLALWLAGHVVQGDPQATQALREAMLEVHLSAVWQLVPINYEAFIEPKLRRRRN